MDRKNTFQLPAEKIPARSSSRSPEKSNASDLKRIRDWKNEREACNEEAKRQKWRLKLSSSFDADYWTRRRDIAEKELQATLLTKKISIAEMKDNTRAFVESTDGKALVLRDESYKLDYKHFDAQAQRMGSKDEKFNLRRSFMQLFIGAETGLNLKNCRGKRDSSLQAAFRSELIIKSGSEHPDSSLDYLWCPILCRYQEQYSLVAGHLYPWKCGEATMQAIFGRSDSGYSELFKAENGILWSKPAEIRFEKGYFVVVPDIPDQPTEQQLDTWEASDPKEYKIKVLNSTAEEMTKRVSDTDNRTWAALDNQRLQFKTSFRPRARYLYFTYCTAMLRLSFAAKQHIEVMQAEVRKRFWGTPGRYMLEGMLLGFVEEMGHGYNHLLAGAIKEDKPAVDPTAVVVANQSIQRTLKVDDDEEESDSDDDDDDDDGNNDDKDDNKGDAELPLRRPHGLLDE